MTEKLFEYSTEHSEENRAHIFKYAKVGDFIKSGAGKVMIKEKSDFIIIVETDERVEYSITRQEIFYN